MHYTKVTMKDGTVYDAPILKWRPCKGWFSLFKMSDHIPEKIYFDDVESAVTENQRCRVGLEGIGDEDELWRAINDGWMPKDMARWSTRGWTDIDVHSPDGVETYYTLQEAEEEIPEGCTIYRHVAPHDGVYFFAATEG